MIVALPSPAVEAPERRTSLWHVLRTRSRQEKALHQDLVAMGVRCFLPLVPTVRYYGKRKAKALLPLFSGYVFLLGSLDDCYAADRTGRVAQILPVRDQDQLARELGAIRRVLEAGMPLTPCSPIEVGSRVEVRAGPFKGLCGEVSRIDRDNRLVLNVGLIGRAAALEIDRDLLDLIE